VPPTDRVTSPRLALARSFVVTLLVALTLLGVRAAVSGAAISLSPGGSAKLSSAKADSPTKPSSAPADGEPSSVASAVRLG
jgi:hypothetical protein